MPVVSFCSGAYCRGEEVARKVAETLEAPLLTDGDLVERAARISGRDPKDLHQAMYSKPSAGSGSLKRRGGLLPFLRSAMAELLREENLVFRGLGSHLIPKSVTHALSVCLMAKEEYRIGQALKEGVSEDEAAGMIRSSDELARTWVDYLHGTDAWETGRYDILSPIDKKSFEATVGLIVESARSKPLRPTKGSRGAVLDLALQGRIEAALAAQGHYFPEFKVEVHGPGLRVEINRKVLRLGKLKKDLEEIIRGEAQVLEVETKVGPGFHKSDIYRQVSFELPSKVLLVDDERDFVETLSERLQLREVGTSVVYDGEQALAAVEEDEPEVMVLDLRMPRVDGTEVLRRIKESHPEVEVIVLTGHGTPQDREECLRLGAFAFLQKPVDFEGLSQVMRQALAKRRGSPESRGG